MTQLASSSSGILRYTEELSFGEIPVLGDHKRLPFTGESITYTIDKTSSEEINPNRGVSDMVPTTASASGGVNVEFKFKEYDDFIEAALQGTWKKADETPIEIVVTPTKITTTGAFPVSKLVPGQFFGLKAAQGAKNFRKLFRISTAAGAITATQILLDAATPGVAETLANSFVITSRLRNGATQRSFVIEKEFADVGVFRAYTGMNVSSMSLNAAQGALTTGEFQFMGRGAEKKKDTTSLPGTEMLPTDNRVMTGMTGTICAVWLDGAPLVGTALSSLALSYDNNLRQQNAMCSGGASGIAGAIGIGNGNITTTMSTEMYFSSEDVMYDEFVENRNVEFVMTAFDSVGNGYVITYPKANISSHEVTISGNNQDVMANVELTGLQLVSTNPELNGAVLLIDKISF